MYLVGHGAGIKSGLLRQGDVKSTVANSEGTGQACAIIGNTTASFCAWRR